MNLADYRRFVSYIYAYRNGKKEKNTGFAKIEARKRNLRISIQLEAPGNRETSLDAYGFIRKGEKISGIFLGEMGRISGQLYFLKVETDADNIKESDYGLNQLSGLWIKGEPGENYITVWDDEPVKRMDLEIEREEEKPEKTEIPEEAPAEAPTKAEVENLPDPESGKNEKILLEPETEEASSELENIEIAEIGEIGENTGEQSPESLRRPEKQEKMQIPISSGKPINGVRAQETESIAGMEVGEPMADPASSQFPIDQDQEQKTAEKVPQEAARNQAAESPTAQTPVAENEYREGYAALWERLAPACAHRNPFQDGETADAILLSPRELHFFCCKDWSAAKNSFIYHGYYNFHHLLFGKAANGSFFLAVPGTYSAQEQRMAVSFGFPLFKESRDKALNGRRGYWCRLL